MALIKAIVTHMWITLKCEQQWLTKLKLNSSLYKLNQTKWSK